jgi:hypothetical protein
MNCRSFFYLISLLCISFCSCQRDGIHLVIDSSKSASWRYLLGVDISGKNTGSDSAKRFSSSLRTFLQGQNAPSSDKIKFTVTGTRITTNFLGEAQRINLENQFEKMSLAFSPLEGSLSAPDSQLVPIIDVQGWDLFKNFVKVFPVFPQRTVRQGDTWERERTFPVESNHGDATGHLYQFFSLDSVKLLDNERHFAYISWRFSYQVETLEKNAFSELPMFPLQGDGTAEAVLNLNQGVIESAHAEFETAKDKKEQSQINWHEAIHIELVK